MISTGESNNIRGLIREFQKKYQFQFRMIRSSHVEKQHGVREDEQATDELIRQAAESRGQAVAEVRSAVTLNDDQRGRLKSALSSATGMNIDIVVVVDPEILGGVVAQVGDTVFDGSVRTRLEKMKERLS